LVLLRCQMMMKLKKQLTNWTELLFKDAIVVNKSEPKPEGERRSFNNNRGGDSRGVTEQQSRMVVTERRKILIF
jgi:hypothetical protein